MTPQEFWATKSKRPEFLAVVFEHPEFEEPIRLVANQFEPVTLGGSVHTPCSMVISPPEQSNEPIASLKVSFPRAVVGREFKRKLKSITAAGRLAPITVSYRHYIGTDLDLPAMSWVLYVGKSGGVVFTPEVVQVTATDANPMRLSAAEIYDPTVFTGLQAV